MGAKRESRRSRSKNPEDPRTKTDRSIRRQARIGSSNRFSSLGKRRAPALHACDYLLNACLFSSIPLVRRCEADCGRVPSSAREAHLIQRWFTSTVLVYVKENRQKVSHKRRRRLPREPFAMLDQRRFSARVHRPRPHAVQSHVARRRHQAPPSGSDRAEPRLADDDRTFPRAAEGRVEPDGLLARIRSRRDASLSLLSFATRNRALR